MEQSGDSKLLQFQRVELKCLAYDQRQSAGSQRMSTERGVTAPVLTQCHENGGIGERSHDDRDFLDRFGRLPSIDRPCLGDGRKNGLYSLIQLLFGLLRLSIFLVQLGEGLGSFENGGIGDLGRRWGCIR